MNETKKGNAYLCYCVGDTQAPMAAIFDDLDGVRRFLIGEIFSEDNAAEVQEIIDDLEWRDWREEGHYWLGFEDGSIEVRDVLKA